MKHWRRHSQQVTRSRLFGSPDAECVSGQRRIRSALQCPSPRPKLSWRYPSRFLAGWNRTAGRELPAGFL
jgi:hypothetical protein